MKGGRTIIGNVRHHALEQMLKGLALAPGQAAQQRRERARSCRKDGAGGPCASSREHQGDRAAISTRLALDEPAVHQPINHSYGRRLRAPDDAGQVPHRAARPGLEMHQGARLRLAHARYCCDRCSQSIDRCQGRDAQELVNSIGHDICIAHLMRYA
ncbi:MAG TPA: hypothetical protein VJU80_08795 [Solirubrobacteraceae bacterium]|nr:hypothetical protein [Solirubrobacteraceae bacterium]